MNVIPPFAQLLDHTGNKSERRLERVRQTTWSESDWDRIIIDHADLLGAALRSAEMIEETSELRLLGQQIDSVDIVFAEVSHDPDHPELRRLILVEDKLLRNAQSKRTVLAQILEYSQVAQEVWPSANLVDKFAAGDPQWIKTHEEHLKQLCRTGDLLLVIVGDQIDDGLARLAKRFAGHDDPLTLAELVLVSMPLFQLEDGYLLLPHVVSAVERHQRELTVRVVVQDRAGKPLDADIERAEPEPQAGSKAPVVRDEVVRFLRSVRDQVTELLPGVPGTKVPRKSLDFCRELPTARP